MKAFRNILAPEGTALTKEATMATNSTANVTANNDNAKEVKEMKGLENIISRLGVKKTNEEGYMTKADILEELSTFGVSYSKAEARKVKRAELAEQLTTLVMESINADNDVNSNEKEDREMKETKTMRRYDTLSDKQKELLVLIENEVSKNNEEGWGYGISYFMLKALIAKAYCGCEKLSDAYKANKVSPEVERFFNKSVKGMYDLGWITPVTVKRHVNTLDGKDSVISVGILNDYNIGGSRYSQTIVVDRLGSFRLNDVGMFGVNRNAINGYLTQEVVVG